MGLALLLVGLAADPSPVLVELFSSEGCSSCPAAEALLREKSIEDPSLLVLEFHVDYWNGLGWKDRFSSSGFTDRQSGYAALRGSGQVFTPEAIVDGRASIVGSDAEALDRALSREKRVPPTPLRVRMDDGRIEIDGDATPAGRLWIAATESGLETTPPRGENRGRRIAHAPVVRSFKDLGTVAAGELHRKVQVSIDPGWKRGAMRFVIAVQDPGTGGILALGATSP